MATPIPYSIKKGDTLSKIAQKLGIDDWQHLRTYHNNYCQPISEQIAEQLKEGKTLLTPSQDEIEKMNGKSQKNIEERQDEEKEIAAHEDDKKEEKQLEASKGEHENKYFVVHGAQCSCDQSEIPKKLAKLQVTTHSKVVFNDEDGKYAATEEDKTFDPVASTFGNCKLKPNGSSYSPCVIVAAPKWDKPYDKTKILGKKVLTEISELKCLTGGKIAIEKHGQTDAVLTQHAENTNALELAMANPALKMPPKKSDIPNVSYIIAKKIENHSDFKELRSDEGTGVEKIVARPHEEITFEAKLKSGNKKLVSWLIYEGHEGKNEQRLFLREQIGCEFKNSFEPGKYRIEGYGQPKEGKSDKNYPSASFDLEIAHNRLDGSALLPASGDFAIGSVGKHKLRKGFPARFDPKFLMTPTDEEADRLKMYVLDEAGNIASPYMVIMNQLAFTPKNSVAKYNFIAEYTDAEGNVSIQNYEAETIPNSVLGVKHETETVRPFTNMNFSVLVKSDDDLTSPELTDIKWSFNGKIMGQGRTFALPGTMLSAVGEYTVKAQALSSLGFVKSSKNEFDEWHFKVAENDVVSCYLSTDTKVGKQILITPKYIFKDKLPAEKVNWHLESSGQNVMSEVLNYKAMSAGKKIISCKINSQKGIRIIVDVKQAVINDVMFTDSNGLKIEKASWGQKINIWIDQKELIGEKLEIVVWDDDAGSPDDPVKTITVEIYDGKLIPFLLDNVVKNLTGKVGAFYVKVKTPELKAINNGKEFPKVRLGVADEREIYSAEFAPQNIEKTDGSGSQKQVMTDYNQVNYLYAHTRGIPTTEKLDIELWETKRETAFQVFTGATVDESGLLKVKIDWSKMKEKKFRTVYAKIKSQKNGEILYDAKADLSKATIMLFNIPLILTEAGYKSAVMVGGSNNISNSSGCGWKFCIKKGDKSELIREINIRLSGFGGNVPTDEFTERTEKMVKQFQKDYMQVEETGKVCGNVLMSIDEFQRKYSIHFDDIKCKCGSCNGFGTGKFKSVYTLGKPKIEAYYKYEYPGIHRSLVFALKATMFYSSIKEKDLGYSVKCVFSGYRCWNDNSFHGRTSTNHMGKALDIHFFKNGKRKNVLIADMEEVRENIFIKYLGAQLRWPNKNKFSLEPTRKSYPKEFIATTWIHYDIREFDSKYLEDKYFSETNEGVEGQNITQLAKDLKFHNMCNCFSSSKGTLNNSVTIDKTKKNNFTIEEAELALKEVKNEYGIDMAKNIEMIYRWECDHFRSGQYANCGAPGMEVSNDAKGPEYGWNGDLYDQYPEYTPIGLWTKFENKGKSGFGGNEQVTDKPKRYIMFPTVEAGMFYVAEFILRHNGNIGRWHSLNTTTQKNYIKDITSTIPRISNKF